MSRSLALDIGNRRIGVAVSDATKLIARPLCVVDRKTENALMRLVALVGEHQADEIIVGLPLNANGTKGEQAERVEQFVAQLEGRVTVPVKLVDERYSTMEAQSIMSQNGKRSGPRSSPRTGKSAPPDDAVAAAVILQRYLDDQRAAFLPVQDEEW